MREKEERKAILRAWLYRLLAEIELCESVDAIRHLRNRDNIIIDMKFTYLDDTV